MTAVQPALDALSTDDVLQPICYTLQINQRDRYVVWVYEDRLEIKHKRKSVCIRIGDTVRFFHWSAMRMMSGRLEQIYILPCLDEFTAIVRVSDFYLEPTEVVPIMWEEVEDMVRDFHERYFSS